MNPYLKTDNDTLIEDCIKGNQDYLNLFYTRFAPKMFSVIMRYVSNPNDAEDILHDGFIVAFTSLNSLRNPESVEYWLASIMKNLSLQFLQAQDVVNILHEIPEVEDSPEFNDIIDLSTLETLIKKLPKGYQTVFRLSVLENKTHKEIADILGIAPNSSSSQLFHAKLMMRKLISEHRRKIELISLLMIVLSAYILWWQQPDNSTDGKAFDSEKNTICQSTYSTEGATTNHTEGSQPLSNYNSATHTMSVKRQISQVQHISSPVISVISADTVTSAYNMNESGDTKTAINDTITKEPSNNILTNLTEQDQYAYNYDYIPQNSNKRQDWSLKIGASSGISIRNMGALDASCPSPGDGNLNQDDDNKEGISPRRHRIKQFKYLAHNNDLPITVALTMNKSISRIFGFETGITYTYLHSTLENGNNFCDCRWHYFGIPLKLTVNNFSNKLFRLYASAGAQLDIPLYSSASTSSNVPVQIVPSGRFHSPMVWSVSVSYGINFNITRQLGIFIEPSLQYHFNHDYDIPNTWTDNNLNFSVPIGFRFNF